MDKNKNLKTYSFPEIPHCRVHGRTDTSQEILPLFWTGSGIEVNVTGTELWVDIDVDFAFQEPWAAVSIDGAVMSRQMLLPGSYSVCLFRNMGAEDVKNVRFIRELQAMSDDDDCHLWIRGLKSDGAFLPIAERKYKLEFIGDSITSGEGTYGSKGEHPWISMYMSASRNYAAMVADALDADLRILSQGGWGVVCGWDNDRRHALPRYYEQICGLANGSRNRSKGAGKPNPFTEWKPDAIIVNLGTNDSGALSQPPFTDPKTGKAFKLHKNEDGTLPPEDARIFEKGVISFLKKLRKNNPDSRIVWVYGMLGYDLTLYIAEAIRDYSVKCSDAGVSFLQLPNTTEETLGARFHPGVLSHERAAAVITEYLKTILP